MKGPEGEEVNESFHVKENDALNESEESLLVTTHVKEDDKVVDEAFSREIIPGKETTIKIQKGSNGLGLSIVGGSDTLLVCV